jgi:hypothetical protein
LIATFPAAGALHTEQARAPDSLERAVFSCNYNGWADVPEEEREGLDAFETARLPQLPAVVVALMIRGPVSLPRLLPRRRAA